MWILTKKQIKTKFSRLVMGNQDLVQLSTDYNNRRQMRIRIRKICNRWQVLARPKKESHLIKARKSKILKACKKILKAWQWVLKAPRRKSSRTWRRAKVKMKPKGERGEWKGKSKGKGEKVDKKKVLRLYFLFCPFLILKTLHSCNAFVGQDPD